MSALNEYVLWKWGYNDKLCIHYGKIKYRAQNVDLRRRQVRV